MASRPTRLKIDVEDFARTCATHKVAFPSYAAALDGAERAMENGHVTPGCHITPYECQECGRWHVRNRVIVPLPGINVPNRTDHRLTRVDDERML